MAKRKRTNNDPENITHKTEYQVTWTPLKPGETIKIFLNSDYLPLVTSNSSYIIEITVHM
jgi:hypothetical protein